MSALPASRLVAVTPAMLGPAVRNPVLAAAFAHEVAAAQNVPVMAVIPCPVAGRPDEPDARRRHHFIARWRRSDVDVDVEPRSRGETQRTPHPHTITAL